MLRKLLFFLICFSSLITSAQTTISGTVFDEYLEPFPGAIISSPYGTTTSDFEGTFTLQVNQLPVTIKVTSAGYSTETLEISGDTDDINIILKEAYALDQVVVSASRTPERVMESPVTIERAGDKFIKNTASPNFYEGLKNLKGIHVLDNNYLTKAIVTNRGFGSTDNTRFVQLVDGVDTAVPVFEFSLGNNFGLNELDVKNVEILPGAASALYGANAFNGILVMNSKSPFEDEGFSMYKKAGITTEDARGSNGFYDTGFRFAHKFNDNVAMKINTSYITAGDWVANDLSNISGEGFSHANAVTNYNGVNVYGDEISLNLVDLAILASNPETSPLAPINPIGLLALIENPEDIVVSRTGIAETNFADYGVNNLLLDVSLHFKPWDENTEIILSTKYGIGDNVVQVGNRYFQENSSMVQYRAELKGENYFIRGYYNKNDAGDTYDSKLAGLFATSAWKSSGDFYNQYAENYFFNYLYPAVLSGATSYTNNDIYTTSRAIVDADIPENIKPYINLAKNTLIADGGAKLFENSGFYNVDANWNLSKLINFENIQVGGSFRSFELNSQGQIYTDYDGVIRYRQFGFYTQVQRKLAEDRLKLTGTIRYDKSRNFAGKFSPRATISYAAGEKKNHNFRIGYQTGFRNPTAQDQYSGLTVGNSILLGSVDDNLDRLTRDVALLSTGFLATSTINGNDAFHNAFTAASVAAFQNDFRENTIDTGFLSPTTSADVNLLVVADFEKVKPETVRSLEVGYRGAVDINNRLFEFDLGAFYNIHEDFITETEVVVPLYGDVNNPFQLASTDQFETVDPNSDINTIIDADAALSLFSAAAVVSGDIQRFGIATNSSAKIKAYGFSAGFNTKLSDDINLGGSYAFSDFSIDETDDNLDFKPAFNTPKHTFKLQASTDNLFKNVGLGIDTRWQDAFLYQSRFVDKIIDARFIVDAQINYTVPSIKSVFKLGATNLLGKNYISVAEAGVVGSQYFISWTFNNL